MTGQDEDLMERVLAALTDRLNAAERPPEEADPFSYVASANYCVPMILDLAVRQGNQIVDDVPRYSSGSHSGNWQAMVHAMRRFADGFRVPYFDRYLVEDPFIESLLGLEEHKLMLRHALVSLQSGLWNLRALTAPASSGSYEVPKGLTARVVLAERSRRSALQLLAHRVSRENEPVDSAAVLDRWEREQGVPDVPALALGMGLSQLRVFTEATGNEWRQLVAEATLRDDMLPLMRAFVLTLGRLESRLWFSPEGLWEQWNRWLVEHVAPSLSREEYDVLLSLHAVTLDEAHAWNVQAPLVAFADCYAVWPFAYHVLPPDLSFLSLLVRRYERLWSRTVGSRLEYAADWLGAQLAAQLPDDTSLRWVARRRKGRVEADLVIADVVTGVVLVLELKTTFDKFRTHVRMTNFVDQRVKYDHAFTQAADAAAAIRSGEWRISELFGGVGFTPSIVYSAVLTWYDTYNPRLGTDRAGRSCNYATLLWLLSAAGGNLQQTVDCIDDLSRLYCPGTLHEWGVKTSDERLGLQLELQTDQLPPRSTWPEVSALTEAILAGYPTWPENYGDLEDAGEMFLY